MRVPVARSARRGVRRRGAAVLSVALAGCFLLPAGAGAHDGEDHGTPAPRAAAPTEVAPKADPVPPPEAEPLAEEPVLPGLDVAVDFQIAPSGDAYIAHQDGRIVRYRRAAGSTAAHPMYDLRGELIYDFEVTRQFDRGLVGITLDSQFESGQRYLYAVITRGSNEWVGNVPGGNPNGIRRTGAVVRIAVPASGSASAGDLKTIVGAGAPADPDSTCKPFMAGQAPPGETDALPNGVLPRLKSDGTPSLFADFGEQHIYPDGNLATRSDGAYDCIPSDADTHGMGAIVSAPDGSLFFSVGDASSYDINDPASMRAFNLESYAGKVMRVDREGRGVAGHPFCPSEADKTQVCTKIWIRGLRNAFRFNVLPPDGGSGGAPVLAVGDVGNFSKERLTIAHPGDNLGWPCWEGTYWAVSYSSPERSSAVRTGWGGPDFTPAGPGNTSCERTTATGNGTGFPQPKGITLPTVEYEHNQGSEPPVPQNGAAIVAGGLLDIPASADPEVALPSTWNGSYVFGDFVRGWLYRIAKDTSDPSNTDRDGGLRVPADEGRSPNIQTDAGPGRPVDSLLERIADPPPKTQVTVEGELQVLPKFYRLTSYPQRDGTVWSMHYGDADVGGLYRIRSAPEVEAVIESATGQCAAAGQTQGNVTLTAADAGPGTTYRWDVDGDGVSDSGRTSRTTTITPAQIPAQGWVRLIVNRGSAQSVAARYLCSGPPPNVQIASPANEAQVVLGKPVTVRATRPAGDADATGIPDSQLRWRVSTVHGSSHEHPLVEKSPPFETVNGQQVMQVTVTPDPSHELGSYTRVRIVATGADSSSVARSIRLVPKPVDVTLRSAPAGAKVSVRRDAGESTVDAPGSVTLAAGASTELSAPASWTGPAGETWWFARWSDGPTTASRGWTVPDDSGQAPIAQYADQPPPPPVPTTPAPPTEMGPEAGPPLTDNGRGIPRVDLPIPPPTAVELRSTKLTTAASGKAKTKVVAKIDLGRPVNNTGIVVKVALRDTNCRWWVFSRARFARPALAGSRGRRTCAEPRGWKLAKVSWGADGDVQIEQRLAKRLPRGRYALRVRFTQGTKVLADRLRSVTVR